MQISNELSPLKAFPEIVSAQESEMSMSFHTFVEKLPKEANDLIQKGVGFVNMISDQELFELSKTKGKWFEYSGLFISFSTKRLSMNIKAKEDSDTILCLNTNKQEGETTLSILIALNAKSKNKTNPKQARVLNVFIPDDTTKDIIYQTSNLPSIEEAISLYGLQT
ncbi:hypothetical protein M0R04_01205 [Candidatus Dojkabacteria bacterium]|jgi:hypothetical protein|nr:hypothetical protein [Candidatus Dojkabacteria bacterium]